jgi:hypothetical protein
MCGFGTPVTRGERGPGLSWQEELRKLDQELAAGQISADEYRVRRDQVLSSAVSAGPGGAGPQPPNKPDETQFIQSAPPIPTPPAGPEKSPVVGEAGDADKTQIVPGGTADPGDRTQAVGGWQTARPSGTDADRTQVVPGIPGVPPQHYAGGQSPRPAPEHGVFPPTPGFPQPMGWQQPEDDVSPPWAGGVFPPLATPGSSEWTRQGPEVFEDGSSSTGKKVLLVVLIVLVLGGLGTGLVFLLRGNDDNPNAQGGGGTSASPSPRPTTTTKPRPSDPNVAILEDLPRPPASQQQQGQVLDLAQLAELKLMDAPEIELLRTAEVTKVPWRSAVRQAPQDGPTPDAMSTMVIPTGSAENATKLLDQLRAYQESQGMLFIPEPLPNMPPSLIFEKSVVAERAVYRGLYVSGKNLVRITTIQAPLTNEASLSGSYRNQTEAMLKAFPAE